jgi:hypothetical protein
MINKFYFILIFVFFAFQVQAQQPNPAPSPTSSTAVKKPTPASKSNAVKTDVIDSKEEKRQKAVQDDAVLKAGGMKITPQVVVDLTLSQGLDARLKQLKAQHSYLTLEQAKGAFDLTFDFRPSYEYTEAQALQGGSNLSDETLTLLGSISKKFQTGTSIGLEYQEVRQTSVLNSFTSTLRNPTADTAWLTLNLRQSLWQNAFGYADRLAIEVGEGTVESALKTRDEDLEGVLLDSITQFWTCYTNEQELRENIAARDKYDTGE